MIGGVGRDPMNGSDGNDGIFAGDGRREPVNGGPGRGRCATDAGDVATTCP